MRIEEVLELYITQLQADGRSPHTTAQARRHVEMFVRWCEANGGVRGIADVQHDLVARFLASDSVKRRADGAPRKATSANALRSSLRAFFSYVYNAGYTASNPARLVRRARCEAPPPRGLSDIDRERLVQEIAKATTWTERRDGALFMTLLLAGLRIGSALAARVEDVDLETGTLRLTRMKNAAADTAFLSPELVAILRPWVGNLARESWLFPGEARGELGARQAHRRLAELARRAGIARPVSPHALRHTFGQRVYARSQDLLATARALCHRSTSATATYARADVSRVRAAIGA